MMPVEYSFQRYLAAKKSIDDRALNGDVWRTMASLLPTSSEGSPLRVLEVGAGTGTMLERTLDRNLFSYAVYTAVDPLEENRVQARQRLGQWATGQGMRVSGTTDRWAITGNERRVEICYRREDFFDFAAAEEEKWDLLIASAFLDLTDIQSTLPLLLKMLDGGGIFYFAINFDGATILEPWIEGDELIMSLYHRSMDERIVNGRRSGDSRAGRHLFSMLNGGGAQILAAGGSDWAVFAGPKGYPGDEAYFLHYIVNDIGHAVMKYTELDTGLLDEWIAKRHAQIKNRELVYIAHQLDFTGITR
jgi:SAM-dependent methyltransferase